MFALKSSGDVTTECLTSAFTGNSITHFVNF